ncbi:MAG: transposase, partial [Verrucomicrobia bacterium]|nr:transposase [Verrucomicrobiota bacterium]
MGYDVNPEPAVIEGKRGRPKRGKALNLLDRFQDREAEVMGFFLCESIPFDNNQAERDLRMIKAKLKISGCFRSAEGAAA